MLLFVSCSSFAQQNIFNHVWWDAIGRHNNQLFGFSGLDTVGRVNDSIPDALIIGEDGGSRYVWNRTKLDTTPQAYFPGTKIVTGDINGDGIKDYVVLDESAEKITVLFGKDTIGKFDTAMVLHGDHYHLEFTNTSIVVGKFDSTDYDGIIISDANYTIQGGTITLGRILYYHGGAKLDSTSVEITIGDTGGRFIGGLIAAGHVRDKSKEYLVETRLHGSYANVFLYPFGHNFTLMPSDTLTISWDIDSTGSFSGTGIESGYLIADANADSTDDIFLGFAGTVLVWKGGKTISSLPSYRFTKPFSTGSSTYGTKLVDLGDITGRGYHSLLVTDPEGDAAGGYFGGTVFLFNMGKALKDVCTAFGSRDDFESYFGTTAIPLSKIAGSNLPGFMVGRNAEILPGPSGVGGITAFYGDTSYGPVSVREIEQIPTVFDLHQNYPNPCTVATSIVFSVLNPRLYGAEATVTLYNSLGTKVATVYRGIADDYSYTLRFDVSGLPAGNYYYRLLCGGREETRMMSIIR